MQRLCRVEKQPFLKIVSDSTCVNNDPPGRGRLL